MLVFEEGGRVIQAKGQEQGIQGPELSNKSIAV